MSSKHEDPLVEALRRKVNTQEKKIERLESRIDDLEDDVVTVGQRTEHLQGFAEGSG